jgi:hypothetical protein
MGSQPCGGEIERVFYQQMGKNLPSRGGSSRCKGPKAGLQLVFEAQVTEALGHWADTSLLLVVDCRYHVDMVPRVRMQVNKVAAVGIGMVVEAWTRAA